MKNSKNNLGFIVLALFVILGFVLAYFLKEDSVEPGDNMTSERPEIKTETDFFDQLVYKDGTKISPSEAQKVIYVEQDGKIMGIEPGDFYAKNKDNPQALYDLSDTLKKSQKEAIKVQKITDLPEVYERYKALFYAQSIDLQTEKEALEKAVKQQTASSDDLMILSSLYEREQGFGRANNVNKQLCSDHQIRCKSTVQSMITGVVKDRSGALSHAEVRVLNDPNSTPIKVGVDGAFTLPFGTYPLQHIVLEVTKTGYQPTQSAFDIPFFAGADYELDLGEIMLNQ